MRNTDVLIIGGGAIGSAAAYFLRSVRHAPAVAVIEPGSRGEQVFAREWDEAVGKPGM